MRAYKYRIYPNTEQIILLAKTFGCTRFLYNRMLSDKIDYYERTKQTLNRTPAFYKQEFEWLKEVDSLALCNVQLHLNTAFRNFFRDKKVGFPKLKSRKRNKHSYTTNRVGKNIDLTATRIKLPKLGKVKVVKHRDAPSLDKLKSVTVSRTPAGRYYVAILYDVNVEVKSVTPDTGIGLDFSMSKLFVDSEGKSIDYPKFYRRAELKLKKAQRTLSRRSEGSNRYLKQRYKIAVLHEKVKNQRKDFLHKLSTLTAKKYDMVCVEDLNMKAMSRSLNFGKSVHDNGWGIFLTFLSYKLEDRGKVLVKIDKWYPSSKTCSVCGKINKNLKLSDREYVCPCGNSMDRDINAAINIAGEGLKTYKAAGHAVTAQLCCAQESARLRSPHFKESA